MRSSDNESDLEGYISKIFLGALKSWRWPAALQGRNRRKSILQKFKFRRAHVKIYSHVISSRLKLKSISPELR